MHQRSNVQADKCGDAETAVPKFAGDILARTAHEWHVWPLCDRSLAICYCSHSFMYLSEAEFFRFWAGLSIASGRTQRGNFTK